VANGRFVLFVIFLALVTASLWLFLSEDTASKKGGRVARVVTVVSDPVVERSFSDVVEALGTAKAEESVTLTSTVADTVSAIHFEDGQIVNKGDLLIELENTEEKAQLREIQSNLKEATKQYKRIEDLVNSGNVSAATLDAERRQLDEARYRLAAEEARLSDRRIMAPFNGLLGLRMVSEGTFLSSGSAITTIDAIDIIKLDFYVPERFVATLGAGQEVEATVQAYPGRLFKGVVTTVDSRIDPVTRSVLVRAEILNSDKALRPGMLMRVDVISRTWQALSVPEEAVVPSGEKAYVFVVVSGIAERREVTLGIRRPGYVEITSGVEVGERVVSQGTFRLGQPGQKVRELKDSKSQEQRS